MDSRDVLRDREYGRNNIGEKDDKLSFERVEFEVSQ